MKSIIFYATLLLTNIATAASNTDLAVSQFEKIVAESARKQPWIVVKLDASSGKWYKRKFLMGEPKYDVKATDSLVTPIVGLVTFVTSVRIAGWAMTKDEAEALPDPDASAKGLDYSVDGRYFFKDAAWRLGDFTYRSIGPDDPLRGSKLTIKPDEISARKSSIAEMLQTWQR